MAFLLNKYLSELVCTKEIFFDLKSNTLNIHIVQYNSLEILFIALETAFQYSFAEKYIDPLRTPIPNLFSLTSEDKFLS